MDDGHCVNPNSPSAKFQLYRVMQQNREADGPSWQFVAPIRFLENIRQSDQPVLPNGHLQDRPAIIATFYAHRNQIVQKYATDFGDLGARFRLDDQVGDNFDDH